MVSQIRIGKVNLNCQAHLPAPVSASALPATSTSRAESRHLRRACAVGAERMCDGIRVRNVGRDQYPLNPQNMGDASWGLVLETFTAIRLLPS